MKKLAPYLQAFPLTAVFVLFFFLPLCLVVVISFFDYQAYDILIPDFVTFNYVDVFTSDVTYATYWITLKFCAIVWAITFVIGFFVAYFLAFYVHSLRWQITLFLLCYYYAHYLQ